MKEDVPIKNGIIIPGHEIEVTVSRSGGPGGQHVNKTESRVTVYWNVRTSSALTEVQKERIINNLQNRLTTEGTLIVHNNESRSQQTNKERAIASLTATVRKALHVPKKRMKTIVPAKVKEARLYAKALRSSIKKTRSKKFTED